MQLPGFQRFKILKNFKPLIIKHLTFENVAMKAKYTFLTYIHCKIHHLSIYYIILYTLKCINEH